MLTDLKNKMQAHLGGLILLSICTTASAGEVKIIAAELTHSGASQWSVSVTLEHDDTGWDHYADNWRVVDSQGNVLGDRLLAHPHENEQPFTRSLSNVQIPEGITKVFIEAHDKEHGWTEKRLVIDLEQVQNGHLMVEAVKEQA